ncbi:MAG: hypothetical protein ABIW76_08765 [Fibrobacteria bacterium]
MKKIILTTLLIGILSSTALAAWSNPVQVNKIKLTNDNRILFSTTAYPNDARWWVFDASTAVGKSMLSILIASKTTGIFIKYDEGSAYPNGTGGTVQGWYYANQVELQ